MLFQVKDFPMAVERYNIERTTGVADLGSEIGGPSYR